MLLRPSVNSRNLRMPRQNEPLHLPRVRRRRVFTWVFRKACNSFVACVGKCLRLEEVLFLGLNGFSPQVLFTSRREILNFPFALHAFEEVHLHFSPFWRVVYSPNFKLAAGWSWTFGMGELHWVAVIPLPSSPIFGGHYEPFQKLYPHFAWSNHKLEWSLSKCHVCRVIPNFCYCTR